MKEIYVEIKVNDCIETMQEETANMAARAEMMGISGVFDVLTMVDEEKEMVGKWATHTLYDLRVLFGRKLTSYTANTTTATFTLQMPDSYPDSAGEAIEGYANKYLVDELLVHWCRQCESASTMKGVESPLGRQQARVRDADIELLKSAMAARGRVWKSRNADETVTDSQGNKINDNRVWIEG